MKPLQNRGVAVLAAVFLSFPSAVAADPAALAAPEAEPRIRSLLADLVAAGTTNPPGDEARAVAVAVRRLRAAKVPFEVKEFAPGRENLVAWVPGGSEGNEGNEEKEKPILLLAHSDVVGAASAGPRIRIN